MVIFEGDNLTCHGLVSKHSLLPMCQCSSKISLILQLSTLQVSAPEMVPDLLSNTWCDQHVDRLGNSSPCHLPVGPDNTGHSGVVSNMKIIFLVEWRLA